MSSVLSPQEHRFALEYLRNEKNATTAAVNAGYAAPSATATGSRLLARQEIQDEIERLKTRIFGKLELSVARVIQERARLALFDPRKLFDEQGNPKPIHELDDDTAAAIAGLDVDEITEGRGDKARVVGVTKKYKLADKNASLIALEKHMGIYREEGGESAPLTIHIHL